MTLLSVDSLSAYHGNVRALWDVSLKVEEGETVALLGANGAGKSTLLRSIMGLVRPSSGSVKLRGEEISSRRPHEIVSRGVSFVPEGRRLFPAMTADENLAVAVPRGCRDAEQRMAEVYSTFPSLTEKRSLQAGTLSGGEQQMIAIGRAMMTKPALLVVDEPSLGLSPAATGRTLKALRGLADEGTSVLLAEQNLDLALSASDRAYVFENGHIAMSGASATLVNDPHVQGAYLGGEV